MLMDRPTVSAALGLPSRDSLDFFKLKHSFQDNKDCSAKHEKPTWDDLKRQSIRLALQLYMQHFHITYPHRWTLPEKTLAVEYTQRDIHREGIKYDYSQYLLYMILTRDEEL